jgi:hypothetical protein
MGALGPTTRDPTLTLPNAAGISKTKFPNGGESQAKIADFSLILAPQHRTGGFQRRVERKQ